MRYIGNQEVIRRYIGDTLVWEKESPPVEPRTMTKRPVGTTDFSYGYWESLPSDYVSKSNLPLLVFLHASDEGGTGNSSDLDKVLEWGIPKFCSNGNWDDKGHDFVMLAPQNNTSVDWYFDPDRLDEFLNQSIQEYKINPDRVYLVGISSGGFAPFTYLGIYGNTSIPAAIVSMSAFLDPAEGGTFSKIAESDIPIWIISNRNDPAIPFTDNGSESVIATRDAVNAINSGQVLVSAYNANDHTSAWDKTMDGTGMGTVMPQYDPFDESIYDWMMQYVRPA